MRAALVGAAYVNAAHLQAECIDCVIAVDGGYAALARIGMRPDIAVGDFDSLGFTPDCPTRTFPVEKDASDMELALREARARGADEVLVYGGFSARLDHTLANLQMLLGAARQGLRVFGIGDAFAITALAGAAGAPGHLAFAGAALQRAGLAVEGHAHDAPQLDNPCPPRRARAWRHQAPTAISVSVFAFCRAGSGRERAGAEVHAGQRGPAGYHQLGAVERVHRRRCRNQRSRRRAGRHLPWKPGRPSSAERRGTAPVGTDGVLCPAAPTAGVACCAAVPAQPAAGGLYSISASGNASRNVGVLAQAG